ncbi:VOC family protein [Roseivirga sp.]|uniref:VOC family protein n=1 Tax=Roseivirga sp. TaxID=1964215 RepID=UPI003B8E08E4
MRYAHTNIVSKDWEALAEFYVRTFDCTIIPPIRNQSGKWLTKGTGVKNAKLKGAHLLLPGHGENGPTLEIYQYEEILNLESITPNTRGFSHIAFEVDSVETVLNKLMQNGGSAYGEITTREVLGVGTITFIYAKDPEGNLIELQSWK